MDSTRMIYERLMRKAFEVDSRKDLWFTDADHYDNLAKYHREIIAYIICALSVLRAENGIITQLIKRMSELEGREYNSTLANEIDNVVIEISNNHIA